MNVFTEDYGILRFANIYLTRLTAKLFHYFQLFSSEHISANFGCKRTCVRAPARCIKLFTYSEPCFILARGSLCVCVDCRL